MENNEHDQVIYYGSEVKVLDDGKLGGYLVLFGDADNTDLVGDYFTKDTDFGAHQTSMVLYQHGLDAQLKRRVLDPQASIKTDDVGVWVEAQLELRDEYEKAIFDMAKAGKLGWSSGTASHLVEREPSGKAMKITRWPLGLDSSLTPTPAEPRTQVLPLKSLKIDSDLLQDNGELSGESQKVDININITSDNEARIMSEDTTQVEESEAPEVATKDEVGALSNEVKEMGKQFSELMTSLTKSGKMKDAGYIAPDDELGKPEVKSFGDFLIAVGRNNQKRLNTVYKSQKDLSGETGTAGGYLVPEEFANQLIQMAAMSNPITSRVTRVPVMRDTGRYPALDQYAAPTAGSGNTAFAGGITSTSTAPGAALTETDATFEMLQWNVNKVGGFTQVENELAADSPMAIEALLTQLFSVAIGAKTEHYILRGTGAGEPEGILNSAAAIGVTTATDNTFAWADALSMLSRFRSMGGTPVWIIHPGVWPDIGVFEVGTGGAVFNNNLQAGMPNSLLGYEIIVSEHMPQDDGDDVILADLSAYYMFDRAGLSVAFSEHFAFTSDIGTYRFYRRLDGMTAMRSAITLADPTGSYTVSPFVYHDD